MIRNIRTLQIVLNSVVVHQELEASQSNHLPCRSQAGVAEMNNGISSDMFSRYLIHATVAVGCITENGDPAKI